MKKICVVTSTRAEYGVLKNLIEYLDKDEFLELCLVVTGTHLVNEFGMTVNEILENGHMISEKIEILMSSNTPTAISKTMGMASIAFSEMFQRQKPDMLVIVGDRYELLPICSSAMIFHIPIAHISGGEVTEGAIDDVVRHCITKMSYLHFPACEVYRKRLIQLGEDPNRIFNYGDLGIENIYNTKYLTKEELSEELNIDLEKPYVIVTFHPVTLEYDNEIEQLNELLSALEVMDNYQYIITKSNADLGGQVINTILENYCISHENAFLFASLGSVRYISAIRYCEFVLGNSSSGLYEVPALRKPTINIGNRQKGRIMAESIINCKTYKGDIIRAMNQAKNPEFLNNVQRMDIPFTGDHTSYKIVKQIKDILEKEPINLKKRFYDVSFSIEE